MADSRKDSKGRKLRDGETERVDGRYCFRYTDSRTGKRQGIYAHDLVTLREKEKQIAKDIEDGILADRATKKLTLNEMFAEYMQTRKLKESTRANYQRIWNNHIKDELGVIKVVQLRSSDIKKLYMKLSNAGYAHTTIKTLHNMIYPALELAVEDDIIRKNPAKHALSSEMGNEARERDALTLQQQERLLRFVRNSNVYNIHEPMLVILLETAVRCGELIGLRWRDVDMAKQEVSIDHQLTYKNYDDETGYKFHMTEPKTDAGVRKIPMTQAARKAFHKQKENNMLLGRHCEVEIDGYSDFIFLTKHGHPMMPSAVNNILYNIVDAYNKEEAGKAKKEHRKAELLPRFSVHVLRHTACTNMARTGMNIKAVQYVMGHANCEVTMNVYNHLANVDEAREEMLRAGFLSRVV